MELENDENVCENNHEERVGMISEIVGRYIFFGKAETSRMIFAFAN